VKQTLKRIRSFLLVLAMILSLCTQGAAANGSFLLSGDTKSGTVGKSNVITTSETADSSANTATGLVVAENEPAVSEESGGGGGDSSYPDLDDVKGAAAVLIDGDTVSTVNDSTTASSFGGTLDVADGGEVTADSISGVAITGKDYSGATEDSNTDNGIVINRSSSDDLVRVGNSTDYYDVDVDGKGSVKSFNSTIVMQNEESVDDAKEGDDGVGVILDTGGMVLDNVYIKTDGMRSPALYNMNADSVVVVNNSWLETNGGSSWHPVFTMLTASTRAALLFGGETWFYNDNIITQDWGCLSQEGNNSGTKTYSVNSYLEAYKGGYGAYVLNENFMYFYGTEIQATDYGVFLCGNATADVGSVADSQNDSSVVSNMDTYGITVDPASYQVDGGKSKIAAVINGIVVHTNGAVSGEPSAVLNAKDSIVTTDTDNGLSSTGLTGKDISLDIDWRWTDSDDSSTFNNGQTWFFMKNMWGSDVLVRSMNAAFTFDNCDMYASNGVLLQSVVSYDPNGGSSMYRASGGDAKQGITADFENNDYSGDILHQDYQRPMSVTLENATLTGKIESGTMAAWNALWSADEMKAMLEEAGLDTAALTDSRVATIQDALIQDTSYDGDVNQTGVSLTVDGDSTWTVTETSSLGSLTVEDGGSVTAPAGYTMTIYTGCDTSSDLLYYDTGSAAVVTTLTAGQTYDDVVIVIAADQGGIGTGVTFSPRIQITDGIRDTLGELTDMQALLTVGASGSVTDATASGIQIETSTSGYSGVYVSGSSSIYRLGGTDDFYTINGEGYNSAILLDDSDVETTTANYSTELAAGFGYGVKGGTAYLDNSYIDTVGSGRPALYTGSQGTMIVKDSYLEAEGGTSSFIPGFKLIYGSTRANLTTGGTTYYYHSTVKSNDWGALSTDTGGADKTFLYAYDTYAESTNGGYGTYADTDCFVYLFGSTLQSGEFGAILSNSGELYAASGSDAPETVTANMDSDDETTTQASSITGARNAVMVHTVDSSQNGDTAAMTYSAVLSVKDGTLSTVTDLTSAGDYENDHMVGAAAPYIGHHLGSVILFRSGNADVSLDDVTMTSSNGVLLQSVPDYDPGGAVYPIDGDEALGISVSLKDMNLTGDILHEDYQRKMSLNLSGTSLTGKIVSGTMEAWNSLWSSYSTDIQDALIQNEDYDSVWGVRMTVDADSSWVVTETSSLASLTVEDGASITAPEGYILTVYKDCDMDNDQSFYDTAAGTQVASLEAGVTYTGVVLKVTPAALEQYVVSLVPSARTLVTGDTIQVSVVVQSENCDTVSAYQADISYDPALLTLTSADGSNNFDYNEISSGVIRVTGYGDDIAIEENGTVVAVLTFTTTSSSGSCTLGLSNLTVSSGSSAATDASVAVSGEEATVYANMSGYVIAFLETGSYNAEPQGQKVMLVQVLNPQEGMTCYYNGAAMYYSEMYECYVTMVDQDLTAEVAESLITAVEGTDLTVSYDGDVTENGQVNINDAQLVYNFYSEKRLDETVSILQRLEADVNGDQVVDSADARAIQVMILNLSGQ